MFAAAHKLQEYVVAMENTKLTTVMPVDKGETTFGVTAQSQDGWMLARFRCSGQHSAEALRDAIREHADSLHYVVDLRQHP